MNVISIRKARVKGSALWLIPIALAGVGLLLLCTPRGLGLGGDSYFYVSGARNLAGGLGFSRFAGTGELRAITHFPPLYSAFLAIPAAFGVDLLAAARWINALVFGANIFLIGVLLHRHTDSLVVATLGSVIALGARLMLTVHSWVLTEGLFILLLLLWVFVLTQYLVGHGRAFLVVASFIAAMCFLTRYVGITVIATGLLLAFFYAGRTRQRRWADTFWMAGGSLVLPAIWLVRNYLLTGSHTNRVPGWHPMPLERISDGFDAVSLWVAPEFIPTLARYLAAIAVLAVLLGMGIAVAKSVLSENGRSGGQPETRSFLFVLCAFLLVYVLLLATSLSLFDAATPVDGRILSPTFPAALLLLGTAGSQAYTLGRISKNAKRAFLGLAAVLAAFSLLQGGITGMRLLADGQGFSAKAWRESELIQFVGFLAPQAPIYSNEIDAIYLLTGKTGTLVPVRWDPVKDAPAAGYQDGLEVMRARLVEGRGALVLFNTIHRQEGFLASIEDLTEGLTPVLQAADGAVYMRTASSPCSTCP